jgi:hypothetical protein
MGVSKFKVGPSPLATMINLNAIGGAGGTASLRWEKITMNYEHWFVSGDTSADIELYNLPARQCLHKIIAYATERFTNEEPSTWVNLTVHEPTNGIVFFEGYEVSHEPDGANIAPIIGLSPYAKDGLVYHMTEGTSIRATLISNTGITNLNQGEVDFYILVSDLPN